MEERKKGANKKRGDGGLQGAKIIIAEAMNAQGISSEEIEKLNQMSQNQAFTRIHKKLVEDDVKLIAVRFVRMRDTQSQGYQRTQAFAVNGPPVLVKVGTLNHFIDQMKRGFNYLVTQDYDDGDESFEDVNIGEIKYMEEKQITKAYMKSMFEKSIVQAKHQPINMLEGFCIQKFKASHTFSCLQESLAIIFFYKYALKDDKEQLIYESIQKWRDRVYQLIFSFDESLRLSLQTECPYNIVPEFNRWLKLQGFDYFVGVYQYVTMDIYDFDYDNIQNFIISYRQHVYPFTKYGLDKIIESQEQIIEKKQKVTQKKFQGGYCLKSTIKQYLAELQSGQYSKYKDLADKEPREVSHQRIYKLCYQLPQESNQQFKLRQMEWIMHRYKKFDKFCELGIDSETYTDNVSTGLIGHGNQVPYLICFAGRIQKQNENGQIEIHDYNIDTNQDREKILEQAKSQSFWGVDCWEQFVKWIKINKYYQSGYIGQRKLEIGGEIESRTKKYIKNNNQNTLRLQNFIVAHNGGKFDYGYLFSYLSQYIGIVDIIGTQSQIKALHCNNIYFYDTSLVHVGSLADQCRAFLDQKDWKRSINNVVVEVEDYKKMSEERKDELIYYCLYDAHAVYKLHQAQFRDIYAQPFGHGFMQNRQNKSPFIHSSASLAVNIFQNQFLDVDLKCFPKTYLMERLSMRGGHTQVYLPYMSLGVCIDIKSSYPASMYNQMPFEPIEKEMFTIKGGIDVWKLQFENYDLLAVKEFDFPKDINYPSCVIKVFEKGEITGPYDIICPRTYTERETVLFMWGVEVKLARDMGAKIIISGHLRYRPHPVFKNYIEKIFSIRQSWGENGHVLKYYSGEMMLMHASPVAQEQIESFNYRMTGEHQKLPSMMIGYKEKYPECWERLQCFRKIQDKTCKLLMNSLFGKTGQKSYDQYKCGITEDIFEAAYEKAVFEKDQIDGEIRLQAVSDYNIPLMQMTYKQVNQDYNQIGGLVRLASYITAISRCNLVSKMELISTHLGKDRVVYCDTDSIFVQFKTWGDCQQFGQEQKRLLQLANQNYADQEKLDQIGLSVEQLIKSHPDYLKLLNIKVQDIRFIDDPTKRIEFIKMDEEVLGTFQLEKFVLDGQFMASKAYCGFMQQNGRMSEVIKIKGVRIIDLKNAKEQHLKNELFQEKKEVVKLFRQTHNSILDGDFKRCGFLVNSMDNFQRIGTMTSVHVRQKICCHSLIKRKFIFQNDSERELPLVWSSEAHQTVNDFFMAKAKLESQRQEIHNLIFLEKIQEIEKYQNDPGTKQVQQAVQAISNNQKVLNVRKNIIPDLFNQQFQGLPVFIKKLYDEKDEGFFQFVRDRYPNNRQNILEKEVRRLQMFGKKRGEEQVNQEQLQLVAQAKTIYDYAEMINFGIGMIESLKNLIINFLEYTFQRGNEDMILRYRNLEYIFLENQILMSHLLADSDLNLSLLIQNIIGQKKMAVNIIEKIEKNQQKRVEKCKLVQDMKEILNKEFLIALKVWLVDNPYEKIEQKISEYLALVLPQDQLIKIFYGSNIGQYSTHLSSGSKKLIKYIKSCLAKFSNEDKIEVKARKQQQMRERAARSITDFTSSQLEQIEEAINNELRENRDNMIAQMSESEINEASEELDLLCEQIMKNEE